MYGRSLVGTDDKSFFLKIRKYRYLYNVRFRWNVWFHMHNVHWGYISFSGGSLRKTARDSSRLKSCVLLRLLKEL